MKKYKVTQVKSVINRSQKEKRTIKALGLKRINSHVVVEATPQIQGMINKVESLVEIEEAK